VTEAPTAGPALELRGVAKAFGEVTALDRVDMVVQAGTVHALLGENGAGKSTLMRIVFGMTPPDAGEISLFGTRVREHSVSVARGLGVGMVHQHLSLVPSLTAAENLVLGERGRFDPRKAQETLHRLTTSSGLVVPHDAVVRELSIVQQQRLEMLKALARGARLLILDEPTAVLAPAEVDELLQWIRRFADGGGSIILVTHKLREALAVADTVTVLRRGRIAFAGGARESTEETLARSIFQEDVEAAAPPATRSLGEAVVEADGMTASDTRNIPRIRSASFRVRRGELVGVAAVEGSGHRDLLAVLAGLREITAGTLALPPRIAVVPADRVRDGLIPEFSLVENLALHGLGRQRGLMPWTQLADRTAALVARFGIVAPSVRSRAAALSGGNQQRLVIARELEHEVDLVVADNPTRGLDLRATAFVHERLREAAVRGAAVVVHTSDLDELLALATRVLVVFAGTVREVGLDRDAIGRALLGAA
jgi:ABC-type uncharacterized transport system ATPase subunit